MSKFEVTVIQRPKTALIGLKKQTSMKMAMVDCPALWQTFGAQMVSHINPGCLGAYGASFMLNAEVFDYWAAIENSAYNGPMEGLASCELPAGLYARALAPGLDKLGEAYMFLYDGWLQGRTDYAADFKAPSFEFYPAQWQPSDTFEIFMPLEKKQA